ncbi:hypothetical protein [Streptomyces otsuchiensis]|uniref:hypothetical protein n=1 Tax=Streptomyces otsuchiensis TaxID=2681388 RepID=UPI00102F9D09|nr:hypothetical protein [Streptomyces otsuchiensis]
MGWRRRPARALTQHDIAAMLIDVLELAGAHGLDPYPVGDPELIGVAVPEYGTLGVLLGEGEAGVAVVWNPESECWDTWPGAWGMPIPGPDSVS